MASDLYASAVASLDEELCSTEPSQRPKSCISNDSANSSKIEESASKEAESPKKPFIPHSSDLLRRFSSRMELKEKYEEKIYSKNIAFVHAPHLYPSVETLNDGQTTKPNPPSDSSIQPESTRPMLTTNHAGGESQLPNTSTSTPMVMAERMALDQ